MIHNMTDNERSKYPKDWIPSSEEDVHTVWNYYKKKYGIGYLPLVFWKSVEELEPILKETFHKIGDASIAAMCSTNLDRMQERYVKQLPIWRETWKAMFYYRLLMQKLRMEYAIREHDARDPISHAIKCEERMIKKFNTIFDADLGKKSYLIVERD